MKAIKLIFALAFICCAFRPAPSTNYVVNTTTSVIKWVGYANVGTYAPAGTIKIKGGTITLTDETLKAAKIIIDMSSIAHDNNELQEHLKNVDFFDVKKYPEAVFTLSSVKDNMATGKITIKNITRPISFPFTISKENGVITVKAKLKIDRTAFGIKYNSASFFQDLGNYAIKNEFDLDIAMQATIAF